MEQIHERIFDQNLSDIKGMMSTAIMEVQGHMDKYDLEGKEPKFLAADMM